MPKLNKSPSNHSRSSRSAKSSKTSAVRNPTAQPNRVQTNSITKEADIAKRRILRVGIWTLVTLVVFGGLYFAFASNSKASGANVGSGPTYVVASPGPGAPAPPVNLPTTSGSTFNLADYRGQRVLLYFQEGVTCQPCWTQLQAIDTDLGAFHALGITQVASIAIDPASALTEMANSNTITTPVLADSTGVVSNAYHANSYGMMGTSEDGHSFVLVGRTGRILWRGDFGGAPNYTMYVPVKNLLSDLQAGLAHARS